MIFISVIYSFQVRNIQMFHIETRKWSDIAYNFLVGGDGLAYEGRGWDQVGAHTYGYNIKSIGIALVGTFMKELPPNRQVKLLYRNYFFIHSIP